MKAFDAVLVPGGGIRANGELPPWSANRLDRALELADGAPILTLSAGTTHKAPQLDETGRPILESVAGARYLLNRGYPAELLLPEAASYDTIGNIYFVRAIHTDPAGFRKLLVVTSDFHMPRTQAICRWIFQASPVEGSSYKLSFEPVPDVGLETAALDARRSRERASLKSLQVVIREHSTLASVHRWLFTEHAAYAVALQPQSIEHSNSLLHSY
jgi:uncharacterized SAM-binding protein YcdF (DUF218 family)